MFRGYHLRPGRTGPRAGRWLAALAGLCAWVAAQATGHEFRAADSVLVVKSEHRLYLISEGRPYRSYRVSLGLNPYGPKEREGDFRTPEGRYVLDARKVRSDFFLALHVSYPNDADADRARSRGVAPGGSIMIHGLPNVLRRSKSYYLSTDWTNGCIALSNDDMLEVWLLTRPDTPIEIRP